ncbi:MAG: carbohydrate porin [Myxococcota bacterium]|nr:carbohydrate porin [Myxococcota bacterium]
MPNRALRQVLRDARVSGGVTLKLGRAGSEIVSEVPVSTRAACALHASTRAACAAILLLRVLFPCTPARAQAAPPAHHDDAAFDVMNWLTAKGQHHIEDETWNAYGQLTFISSYKPPFYAPYSGAYSLSPSGEVSFTATFTLFLGLRTWRGGEAYFVPELISERPFSSLHGIGGSIQNFELQKGGGDAPQLYRSRTFLRQTIGLGGSLVQKTSDPMQLATTVESRRVVVTAGNFTILDVFDRNSITGDPRQTFFNMAFMTHASWDFPSDARGYSWGATAEIYWDDWALRIGRITPPQQPNQPNIDFQLDKHFGDQVELEHDHTIFGQAGAVRLLAYRNQLDAGRFSEAIAVFRADPERFNAAACGARFHYAEATDPKAPDLCWARQPNVKVGIGMSLEQHVVEDAGFFLRGMYSDGRTEVFAFNPADRSLSFGAVAKGSRWGRSFDVAGLGAGLAWISRAHAEYLGLGGIDGFIGDGRIKAAAEGVIEAFYSVNLLKAIWLSADYQRIMNPGFNADRGPVDIFGARVHAEF